MEARWRSGIASRLAIMRARNRYVVPVRSQGLHRMGWDGMNGIG